MGGRGFHGGRFFLDEVAFTKRDLREIAGRYFDVVLARTYGPITSDHLSSLRLRFTQTACASAGMASDLIAWHYHQQSLPKPRTES